MAVYFEYGLKLKVSEQFFASKGTLICSGLLMWGGDNPEIFRMNYFIMKKLKCRVRCQLKIIIQIKFSLDKWAHRMEIYS